ncbi:unnamed protein product, partial [Ranitomeya imitator]
MMSTYESAMAPTKKRVKTHSLEVRISAFRGDESAGHDVHDKDYRRTAVPDGATRIIWLDGLPTGASREDILSALSGSRPLPEHGVNLIGYMP